MKAHYKWLYDTYWCATLPQLMKRLSKDGVFETLANSGTSISALEEASSHMEIAYELDGPMIICVLIMFHITLSTPLLKVRTEAAFKTFITTKRPVTDLIGEAEKNRGAVVYDETYDLNSVSLESFHRYQCLCQARSPNTWTDLTDYMVTEWEASNFGFSSPEESISKWHALVQEKDEYVETFLSREQQTWEELISVCNFYSVSPPDEQERIAQIMSAVRACHSEAVTARWRKDMVALSDLDYTMVVSAIIQQETRHYTWFPWESKNQKSSAGGQRSGKRSRGTTRRNSAPSRTEEISDDLCPFCKRSGVHDPVDC